MVVMTKSIKVDFAPGEHVETAIKDAMNMAAFTGRQVKFKFNDIPMTIDPPDWAFLGYKFNISPKDGGWAKEIRNKAGWYLSEYQDKAEERDRRFFKKLQKENRGKKKTSRKGKKDCATCEEECALRGDR